MNKWKDLAVKIKKKGKTRGRPSKWEIYASEIISRKFTSENFKIEMNKIIQDNIMYGESRYEISNDGEIKHIPL